MASIFLQGTFCFVDAFSPPSPRRHGQSFTIGDACMEGRGRKFPLTCLHKTNTGEPENPIELTPDYVAEMVEVTFVNACLQLAKG